MSSTTVGEFFLELVVDAGQGELTVVNLVKQMGQLEVASVGEIAILKKLAQSLEEVTSAAIANAMGFTDYAAATGGSTEELQKWQNAAKHVNTDAHTMEAVFRRISHDLATGKMSGDYGGLKNLDVLLTKAHLTLQQFRADKPEELLSAIAHSDYFKSLSPSAKEAILSKSDIAPALRALQIGVEDFKKWSEEGEIMSKEDIAKWSDIHSDMVSVQEISQKIGSIIANWFSDDMQAGLRMTIYLLGKTADLIDPKKSHSPVVEAGKKLVGDVFYPPNLIRDLYKSGKFLGESTAQGLDPQAYQKYFTPNASIMGGVSTPVAAGQKVLNQTINVDISGTDLDQHQMTEAINNAFYDINTRILAHYNSPQ